MNEGQQKARHNSQSLSNRLTEWFMMNRQKAGISLAALIILVIGGIWALQSSNSRKIKDFEMADMLADELQKGPRLFSEKADTEGQDQSLANLKNLTDEYSILQPRFDSLIAEEYMVRGKQENIDPYAKRSIERLRSIGLEDFADFSQVSRLTGLTQYKEALKLANELKVRLAANRQNSDHQYLLEGFLLLHIATLNQKLGAHDAMVSTLVELKEYLGLTRGQKPLTAKQKALASEMLAHLQERQSTLLDFMQEAPAYK